MTVLLVDEASVVRDRIASAIAETDGIDIRTCAPREADMMPLILNGRPDVVVVDIHLPRGGGLELIRRIKAIPAAPRVIALCQASSPQYRAQCHRAGAEYFFDVVHEHEKLTEAVHGLKKELDGS